MPAWICGSSSDVRWFFLTVMAAMSLQNTGRWVGAARWRDLPQLPTIVVYLVGVVPAIWWLLLGAVDRLGADPMRELEHALGLWALRFLIFTLAITPLGNSLASISCAIGALWDC